MKNLAPPDQAKIKSFTGLTTWKEGHRLVLMIYAITKKFPKEEQFGLISQLRLISQKGLEEKHQRIRLSFIQYQSHL